jgi:hypothetical protein
MHFSFMCRVGNRADACLRDFRNLSLSQPNIGPRGKLSGIELLGPTPKTFTRV